MARKKEGKDAANEKPKTTGWESPEMQALDALTRQVLTVPKDEIDRREEEWKKSRNK